MERETEREKRRGGLVRSENDLEGYFRTLRCKKFFLNLNAIDYYSV